MFEEKFRMVLQKDEEVKWNNKSNVMASVFKRLIPTILFGIFLSLFICGMFVPIITSISNFGEMSNFTPADMFKPAIIVFPLLVLPFIFYSFLEAKNTYFCITNKRIIKRSGAFNNNFIHYTLKNVGTVQVVGGITDSNGSATLLITTKDFHTDSEGNTHANRLKINSLYGAYEAYNILSELVEGNNETLRVQLEK